jgi:hypothetical protein
MEASWAFPESPLTSYHFQLYCSRGRKGSGDLPGLQSRRFGPSRVEWWIRLPHASAMLIQCLTSDSTLTSLALHHVAAWNYFFIVRVCYICHRCRLPVSGLALRCCVGDEDEGKKSTEGGSSHEGILRFDHAKFHNPAGTAKCAHRSLWMGIIRKPKTVVYKLEIGPPKF